MIAPLTLADITPTDPIGDAIAAGLAQLGGSAGKKLARPGHPSAVSGCDYSFEQTTIAGIDTDLITITMNNDGTVHTLACIGGDAEAYQAIAAAFIAAYVKPA